MSRNSLGDRLGNIAEQHREKQEWRKHRMAWKFPTRKNYEAWLASQKDSTGEVSEQNTIQTVSSNTRSISGPEDEPSPAPNKASCTAGFGGKKYKRVNGKWVTCGGRRKTQKQKRKTRKQKQKRKTQTHKRR